MKLETAVKYFSLNSQMVTDSSRTTSSVSLIGTNLMGAIGYCQSKAEFGVSAFLAKTGCNGTGRMRDLAESARQGALVDRECDRCSGRCFKRLPVSRAVTLLLPELTQSSWSRNWKLFFEMLVTRCEIKENYADSVFRGMTR